MVIGSGYLLCMEVSKEANEIKPGECTSQLVGNDNRRIPQGFGEVGVLMVGATGRSLTAEGRKKKIATGVQERGGVGT